MNILEMNHIRKTFDEKTVLKDISLSVKEGEVVSIIGPSGSGKSTLLRCATFLEKANGGDISYCGEAVVKNAGETAFYPDKSAIRKAQQNFGLVFQNFNLFPHYSVMKNITDAPVCNQKRPKSEVFKEARELLKKVGLEDKENAYPCELSGGQQQRVLIARALCATESLLILDEPVTGLDPAVTRELYEILEKLNKKEHTAIVMVTHDPQMASYCSRLILLKDGVILEDLKNSGNQDAFYQEILGKMKEL